MALTPGARVGPYEVTGTLGAGGMGEVYRAVDSALGRQVALKVLPEALAHEPDRLARFEREARTLAALNHPNIAQIYGLETAPGSAASPVRALVMELVEGPTLADRVAGGPMPLDEVVPIATQIAAALEAAHEHGIVHRDLKPANIKVRPDGVVKVLDFGLAKPFESAGNESRSAIASQLQTITTPAMTQMGTILGTAAYMAPEQAKGRPADRRADLWAFGCVLYEMLAGRRPFTGDDVSDTLAAVLRAEPDWSQLPSGTPAGLQRLLRLCLAKEPTTRLQSAGDARIRLAEALEEAVVDPTAKSASHGRGVRVWRAAATVSTLAVLALVVPAMTHLREATAVAPPETRTEIVTPATRDSFSLAISPDGRQLVFAGLQDGVSRLWLRRLDATAAQPLPGTEGGTFPFWSPDSRAIAFFANGKLRRFDFAFSRATDVADAIGARGGTWSASGVLLFNQGATGPLVQVPASGGRPVPATRLERGQQNHRFPIILADGRRFVFWVQGFAETRGIYLGSLDSMEVTRLTPSESAGVYLDPGWLLWVQGEALVAQRFDSAARRLVGDPVSVAAPVAGGPFEATGLIVFRAGVANARQLIWRDRAGRTIGQLGNADQNGMSSPRLSPDGQRAAVHRVLNGNADIWLLDRDRATRMTVDPAADRFPEWSPDGRTVVFDSTRNGFRRLFSRASNFAGGDSLLLDPPGMEGEAGTNVGSVPLSWSRAARALLYILVKPGDYDLWVLPDGGKPFPLLATQFTEKGGQFSPDGRWVAYMSSESGRMEIYVRPFLRPDTSATGASRIEGQWQVSNGGGIYPVWSPDGRELLYLAPDGSMMAAPITATASAIRAGAPVALFQAQIVGGGIDNAQNRQYDVSSDGRFLINSVIDDVSPITLIQNWRAPTP
jgi:serine/threonine protein kinase/Tol biopolymer transport system component